MARHQSDLEPDVSTAEDDDDDGEGEGFDLQRLKELAGLLRRAPLRHPKLSVFTFLVVGALGLFATAIIPRTYTSDVKILAQRNLVMPALGNPNRAVPREADDPTKNVADTVLRRENLVAVAKSLNLTDWWDTSRPKPLLVKDAIMRTISGAPSEADKLNMIVDVLEKRLQVNVDNSTVSISVDWSEPKMAYEIATYVEQNFLSAGYDAEVAMINDAIRILEEHARTEQANVDAQMAEVARIHAEASGKEPAPPPVPPTASATPGSPRPAAPAPPPRPVEPAVLTSVDPALLQKLSEKRKAIQQIEDDRTRHMRELRTQMQDAQATLAPAHPTIITLKSKLDAAAADPAELVTLRQEEKVLADQVADAQKAAAAAALSEGAKRQHGSSGAGGTTAVRSPQAAPRSGNRNSNEQTPEMYGALDGLRAAQAKYDEISRRIDAARIELDVVRAAFKYRFSELRPAEIPKGPRKPKVPLLVLGSLVGAVVFALGAALLADRRKGLFVEDWQVRRRLKIPVLGEIPSPRS